MTEDAKMITGMVIVLTSTSIIALICEYFRYLKKAKKYNSGSLKLSFNILSFCTFSSFIITMTSILLGLLLFVFLTFQIANIL